MIAKLDAELVETPRKDWPALWVLKQLLVHAAEHPPDRRQDCDSDGELVKAAPYLMGIRLTCYR